MDHLPRLLSRVRLSCTAPQLVSAANPRLSILQPPLSLSSLGTRRTMASVIEQKIKTLQDYSACDVSDALLKIQRLPPGTTARAGYLADFVPFSPAIGRNETHPKIIAPASTFKFISKSGASLPPSETIPEDKHGFPAGTHWVDWAEPGTVAVIDQPQGQSCAVLGGIMAVRMKYVGVSGVVVNGRIRDLGEITGCKIPVWAHGTSTVGSGAEAKPGSRNVPVNMGGVTVSPGDIIFCDPLEGVVAIPHELLDQVLEVMPKLVAMDDKVKDAVLQGSTVNDAFKAFRTKI